MKAHHSVIRAILREHDDGLSATQIARHLNLSTDSIRHALSKMPDTYIDRWEGPKNGQYAAVWCAVEVPEDCPKPSKMDSDS